MIPESLEALIDQGVIHRVVRPLMAGKEAQVFLVEIEGVQRVAKIYKDSAHRSFKHRSVYTEGRRVKNTRSQRAMSKRSRFGRAQEEEAWKNAEVDAIYRLRAAGVAVPEPIAYVDGVLVMELVADERGEPAPRLVDVQLTRDEARDIFDRVLRDVVRMLCEGLVHGDLSDFNVLLAESGPVIIDFPQAIEAAANRNARRLLVRDVRNLQSFFSRWVPGLRKLRYGEEIWDLYEEGNLTPESKLTGKAKKRGKADTESVLREIEAAVREERARRAALGLDPLPEMSLADDPMVAEMRARADRARDQKPGNGGGGSKRKRRRKGKGSRDRQQAAAGSRGEERGGQRNSQKAPKAAEPAVARRRSGPPAELDLDALLKIED